MSGCQLNHWGCVWVLRQPAFPSTGVFFWLRLFFYSYFQTLSFIIINDEWRCQCCVRVNHRGLLGIAGKGPAPCGVPHVSERGTSWVGPKLASALWSTCKVYVTPSMFNSAALQCKLFGFNRCGHSGRRNAVGVATYAPASKFRYRYEKMARRSLRLQNNLFARKVSQIPFGGVYGTQHH